MLCLDSINTGRVSRQSSELFNFMNVTELKTYSFTIEGAISPKPRPRFNGRQAYLPKRYRNWKQSAIDSLKSQLPIDHQPIEKCSIFVALHGSHRGDLDNLSGSVLDALVQSEAIRDDRLQMVSQLTVKHFPGKQKFAQIEVKEL